MIKLIKLELKRINLKNYFTAAGILGLMLIIFIFFIAKVAQIEQEIEFMNYENIFRFFRAISVLIFGTFSAIMYNRLIIKDYADDRAALILSYPINRQKIFIAKVAIVLLFITVSMLLCTILPILIFLAIESIYSIVNDTITINLSMEAIKMIFVSAIFVNAIGIFSMGIGFIKKSINVSIISALLFSALYGNIAVTASNDLLIFLPIISISFIAIVLVLIILAYHINKMEVI